MRVETQAVPDRLDRAFRSAAEATGAPFGYLLATATRESGLDATAKASTSSATGLFQFIDSTWLEIVKEEGPAYGLSDYANRIERTASGDYRVADREDRRAILALRKDPEVASVMAGAFTRRNAEHLIDALGRAPSEGELYAAHFLGAQGAERLIEAASSTPDLAAARLFPSQASANRRIFYERDGTPRSVSEVYANLTSRHGGGSVEPVAVAQAAPAVDLALPADPSRLFGGRAELFSARPAEPAALPSRYALGFASDESAAASHSRLATEAVFSTAPLSRFSPFRAKAETVEPATAFAAPATESVMETSASAEAVKPVMQIAALGPAIDAAVTSEARRGSAGEAAPAPVRPSQAAVPLPRERPAPFLPIVETEPETLDLGAAPLPRIRPVPGSEEAADAPFNIMKFLGFTRA